MPRLRAAPLLLTLTLLLPAWALGAPTAADAAGVGGAADAAAPCRGLRVEPGLGVACREGAYFRIPLEHGVSVLTHGGDPVPAHLGAETEALASAVPPVCVADPNVEPHGRLLYTRAIDTPSRFDELADDLHAMVLEANARLVRDSTDRGATMTYRMSCDAGGSVDVTEVVLPTPSGHDTFQTMMLDLRVQGYDRTNAKYWIWHDGQIDCGCAGIGTLSLDDRLSGTNHNNAGPSYGATFGYLGSYGAFVMMHENGHNLGAVQREAPASSGAGHCNDGLDVMCYADGGPTSHYTSRACTTREWFDCNHDTYFDPRPSSGEWLFSHWNLGSPFNRFLQGCHYATGALAAGLSGAELDGVSATTVAIPTDCAGRPFALYAQADAIIDDFNVCWHDENGTLLKCHRQRYHDQGKVPTGTASARIVYALGTAGRWTLSIV